MESKINIVLIGDESVGKSSICQKIIGGAFKKC